jgi:hypothetical protein
VGKATWVLVLGDTGDFEAHDVITFDPQGHTYASYLFGGGKAGSSVKKGTRKGDLFE